MGLVHPKFDLPWFYQPFDSQRKGFNYGVDGFINTKSALLHRSPSLERKDEPTEADSTLTFKTTKPYKLGSVEAFSLGCHAPHGHMQSGGCRNVTNFIENYLHIDQRVQPPEVLKGCSISLVWFGVGYRGYSKLRTRTALGTHGRPMPRSIGTPKGWCVSLISRNPYGLERGSPQTRG